MKGALLVFAAAFAICAALGSTGVGCSDGGCPTGNPLPAAQQGLQIKATLLANDAGTSVDLAGGTMDVTGNTVVVRYTFDSIAHEVVYKVYSH